jgi:hypothetical protein
MNAGNRAAVARLAASPRTTTPSGSGASGSGYPWSDGDILYAGDLNAAIELGIASGSGSITQVGLDKRLYGTDGKRLQIRAITSFANTFALFSDGYRFDWGIRNSQNSASIASVSPPINRGGVYGRWLSYTYQDDATCKNTINQYKQYGFNTIRTWVGIGMLKTAPFTDAVTGLSFPTEIELLDNFVRFTQELGMYLWLTFGQGSVPDDQHAAFWAVIATRYRAARHVILDIQNEPGSGTVFVTPSIPTLTTPYSTIMPNLIPSRRRSTTRRGRSIRTSSWPRICITSGVIHYLVTHQLRSLVSATTGTPTSPISRAITASFTVKWDRATRTTISTHSRRLISRPRRSGGRKKNASAAPRSSPRSHWPTTTTTYGIISTSSPSSGT